MRKLYRGSYLANQSVRPVHRNTLPREWSLAGVLYEPHKFSFPLLGTGQQSKCHGASVRRRPSVIRKNDFLRACGIISTKLCHTTLPKR